MNKILVVLLGASAAAVYYLLHVDRSSPLALELVELQSDVPVPIWILLAGLGVLAGLLLHSPKPKPWTAPIQPRKRPPPPKPRMLTATMSDPYAPAPDEKPDWYQKAVSQSQRLSWEQGVRMAWAPAPRIDVMLVCQSSTPARYKRSVEAFAEFLARHPNPRRVRIQARQCDLGSLNLNHEVNGIWRQHFEHGAYRVMVDERNVDLFFTEPAEGWPEP